MKRLIYFAAILSILLATNSLSDKSPTSYILNNQSMASYAMPDFRLYVEADENLTRRIASRLVAINLSGMLKPSFELPIEEAQVLLKNTLKTGINKYFNAEYRQVRVVQKNLIIQARAAAPGVTGPTNSVWNEIVLEPGDYISICADSY